jgi:hypothetical protein
LLDLALDPGHILSALNWHRLTASQLPAEEGFVPGHGLSKPAVRVLQALSFNEAQVRF